jgi:predicted DNA-binding transcriptional regulator AlpA
MKLLNVDEVAAILNVSRRSVWRMRDGGNMPIPVKVMGCVRWRDEDIYAWINDGCPHVRQRNWSPFVKKSR